MSTEKHEQLVEASPTPRAGDRDIYIQARPRAVLTITASQLSAKLEKPPTNWMRILYQMFFFAVGMALVVLSSTAYNDYSEYQKDYLYITSNWRHDYYEKISIGESSSKCADQFDDEQVEMNTYLWPGTLNGCDCTSQQTVEFNPQSGRRRRILQSEEETMTEEESEEEQIVQYIDPAQFTRKIYPGRTCSVEQIRTHCRTVNYQNPKPLQLWSDGNFGIPMRFCGKTRQGYSFATRAPGKSCNFSVEKQCGAGDTIFCVSKNNTCPINYLGFRRQAQFDNGIEQDELSQEVIQAYNNIKQLKEQGKSTEELGDIKQVGRMLNFFYLKNFSGLPPISELRFSETFNYSATSMGGVCFRNNLSNISPFEIDYPLMTNLREQCSTDPRFVRAHIINEEQFYLCNNFIYIQDVLPYYKISQQNQWGIFFRGYIQWKAPCRGSLLRTAIETGDSLLDIQKAQQSLIGISIVYFIIISCIFSMFACLSACGFEWSCIDAKRKDQINLIFIVEVVSKVILQGIQVGIVISTFLKQKATIAFLESVIAKNCSDSYTMTFFISLKNAMNNDFWIWDLAILVVHLCTFIVDMLALALALKSRKQNQEPATGEVKDGAGKTEGLEMVPLKAEEKNSFNQSGGSEDAAVKYETPSANPDKVQEDGVKENSPTPQQVQSNITPEKQ